jgi:hypothetical protein
MDCQQPGPPLQALVQQGLGGFAIGVAPELGVVASLLAGTIAVAALIAKIVIVGTAADAAFIGSDTAAIVGLRGRSQEKQPEGEGGEGKQPINRVYFRDHFERDHAEE